MRRVWAITEAIDTPLTSKMPSGFEIQEIDHGERYYHQANAPDQHVAHRWSALCPSRFGCGLDYASVFLLRHYSS
jgi:hypothetical protein